MFAPLDGCLPIQTTIKELVTLGDLSHARWVATQTNCPVHETFVEASGELFVAQPDYLELIRSTTSQNRRPQAKADKSSCETNWIDVVKNWDDCCSILPKEAEVSNSWPDDSLNTPTELCDDLCCELFIGSPVYLRLPVLHEPALRIRLANQVTMNLEQDGHLRPYDVAGILWPSSYLLSVCFFSACGEVIHNTFEGKHFSAIELGSGIGSASIALNKRMNASVVATDVADQALALVAANALSNEAEIEVSKLDYYNRTQLRSVRRSLSPMGFQLILGSSLQGLFQNTGNATSDLWAAASELLAEEGPSLIILAHTISDSLVAPKNGSFRLLRQISGDEMGMATRWGDRSDFALSFFQRDKDSINSN